MNNELLEETLNYIKNSERILGGEYYIIHSDYIIALEKEIKKLGITIKMEEKIDGKKVIEKLKKEGVGIDTTKL